MLNAFWEMQEHELVISRYVCVQAAGIRIKSLKSYIYLAGHCFLGLSYSFDWYQISEGECYTWGFTLVVHDPYN